MRRREVIRLMVNLLLSLENDLRRSQVVKTIIYDPASGTSGMLVVSEGKTHRFARDLQTKRARLRPGPLEDGTKSNVGQFILPAYRRKRRKRIPSPPLAMPSNPSKGR